MRDVCAGNREVKHHKQVIQQAIGLLQFCKSWVFRGPRAALPRSAHRVPKHVPGYRGVHGLLIVVPLKVAMQCYQHTATFFFVATRREQNSKESLEDGFEARSNDLVRGVPLMAEYDGRRLVAGI